MTQQEAIEIIVREGLTHYHMDERETDEKILGTISSQPRQRSEKDFIIRRQEKLWSIYTANKEHGIVKAHSFDDEKEAWDQFIHMLRQEKQRLQILNVKRKIQQFSCRKAKRIMAREGLTKIRHNINGIGDGEYEIVIRQQQNGLWHVYKTGERAGQIYGITVEKEEEAWGEFIYELRKEKGVDQMRGVIKEEEYPSHLSRKQAEEIISREGLVQYNMDGNQERRAGDTVIREGIHWEVYEMTMEGKKDPNKRAKFFNEEEAWGYLVRKLRYYNQKLESVLMSQEKQKTWVRKLVHNIEKGMKGNDEKNEQEILDRFTYSMNREEAEWFIAREGLTDYIIKYCPQDKTDVIVITKQPWDWCLWEVYEKDQDNQISHGKAEFFLEEEAWRWFLERLRERDRKKRGQTKKGGACYLSRKQAEEIIQREGFTHYNIDPEIKEGPKDIVLRKCRHWEIYKIDENGEEYRYFHSVCYDEEEAWGLFIKRLKENNKEWREQKDREKIIREKEREERQNHVMPRERAEQILAQENLTGYNKNEPREDRPEEMVIRRKGENWEVYCTNSNGEVHGEKELFTVEEEAWGWFIKGVRDNAKIREINRKLFGQDCLFAKIER